jgi:hypothetical protein
VVAVLEALFFSVMTAGWGLYIYVLIKNGFYSHLCEEYSVSTYIDTRHIYTYIDTRPTYTYIDTRPTYTYIDNILGFTVPNLYTIIPQPT